VEEASTLTRLNNVNDSGRSMNNIEEVILFNNDSDNLSSLDFANINVTLQSENVDVNESNIFI